MTSTRRARLLAAPPQLDQVRLAVVTVLGQKVPLLFFLQLFTHELSQPAFPFDADPRADLSHSTQYTSAEALGTRTRRSIAIESNHQLFEWVLSPLVICPFGAHARVPAPHQGRIPSFFPTFRNTSSAVSSSAFVCVLATMVRTRAFPLGTVGKPMPEIGRAHV